MARETLTAEKNIEAAVSLLDSDGVDGFNMRTYSNGPNPLIGGNIQIHKG